MSSTNTDNLRRLWAVRDRAFARLRRRADALAAIRHAIPVETRAGIKLCQQATRLHRSLIERARAIAQ